MRIITIHPSSPDQSPIEFNDERVAKVDIVDNGNVVASVASNPDGTVTIKTTRQVTTNKTNKAAFKQDKSEPYGGRKRCCFE